MLSLSLPERETNINVRQRDMSRKAIQAVLGPLSYIIYRIRQVHHRLSIPTTRAIGFYGVMRGAGSARGERLPGGESSSSVRIRESVL